MSEKESQSYQKMFQEVENIVREINAPDVDLDNMVEQVERGYALISKMRERLQQTKLKIDELQQKYEESDSSTTNAASQSEQD